MKRGETGSYEVTSIDGETVWVFVPAPLPPVPPLDLAGELQRPLETAVLALDRLDGVATLLPDKSLFLYAYIHKEAVLSSQIEGTQSTPTSTSTGASLTTVPSARPSRTSCSTSTCGAIATPRS